MGLHHLKRTLLRILYCSNESPHERPLQISRPTDFRKEDICFEGLSAEHRLMLEKATLPIIPPSTLTLFTHPNPSSTSLPGLSTKTTQTSPLLPKSSTRSISASTSTTLAPSTPSRIVRVKEHGRKISASLSLSPRGAYTAVDKEEIVLEERT